jgi:hypothetical protein
VEVHLSSNADPSLSYIPNSFLTKINCLLTNSYDVSFNNIFQLELLEMGFKRIFFQYLLWTHAYNNAVSDANKAKKMDRSTVSIKNALKL